MVSIHFVLYRIYLWYDQMQIKNTIVEKKKQNNSPNQIQYISSDTTECQNKHYLYIVAYVMFMV